MRRQDFPYFLASLVFVCSLIVLTFFGTAHGSEDESECRTPTHCVLMSLPRWHEDLNEDDEARSVRLLKLANSIDAATDDRTERAFLLMKAWKESRLARFVDLDMPKCRDGINGWCDGGRSFSVFQVKGVPRDSSRLDAAQEALRTLRAGGNLCHSRGTDYWEGGVSIYATGRTCRWSEAKTRVEFMWKLAQRLGKAGG